MALKSARIAAWLLLLALIAPAAEAQQGRIYRVGVVVLGGTYTPAVDGLRDGLKEAGLEEGKQYLLHVRDTRGDTKSAALQAFKPGKSDGFGYMSDAMVISQSALLIEAARVKMMPTIFADRASVLAGGLASYGQSYYELGRLAARHVHKVLLGANAGDLPIEQLDRLHFAINLKAAKALGLTVPQSVLARADEVIE